jgi:asparagine synthase (glutamine-hydrolysing)
MCGIALVAGHEPSRITFRQMLDALRPRGEVEEVAVRTGLLAGAHRLKIVDPAGGAQPLTSPDGRWLLCYNGEIFNYRALRDELSRLGHLFLTNCDTEVVLQAFARWGETAVRRLRGEFAFTLADLVAGRVYLARDPVGVKPLYWSVADGCLHVASEIKALVPAGAPISEVPAGWHGWWPVGGAPDLTPYSGLLSVGAHDGTGADTALASTALASTGLASTGLASTVLASTGGQIESEAETMALVRAALQDSIRVRLDTQHTVGVILSGGLDSSLLLAHVRALHPDCVAFTIGAPGSEDLAFARRLTAEFRVPHEVIEIAPREIRLDDIREAIRISELTEYGDIINAVVSVPLFRRIAETGVKVVLTGDGSDELFGGYPMYQQAKMDQQRRLFLHKIANLGRTELQRVDRVSMGHGVEARVPYLDPAVVELALRVPGRLKVRGGVEKWVLRQAFADVLPGYITARPKSPMSHSSGLHERARMYKPLFARIHRSFGYDLHQPVRRDFSVVLERCGNDLDLALARSQAAGDYSAREHARDLVGAAKWNAAALVGALAGRAGGTTPFRPA